MEIKIAEENVVTLFMEVFSTEKYAEGCEQRAQHCSISHSSVYAMLERAQVSVTDYHYVLEILNLKEEYANWKIEYTKFYENWKKERDSRLGY